MLLPILPISLEQMGVSSSLNGVNATALYIGSFAMTLVAERTLGWLGFKKLMAGGLVLVLVTLLLFPLIPDIRVCFHFNLGSVIGPNISGGLLDFGTQGSMFLVFGGSYVVFGLLGLLVRIKVLTA